MYAAIASRKNGNYLTFNCVFESVALISSQPSDGWLGSASYYNFQVENFWIYFYCIIVRADFDVYSLPYRLLLTGIFLNRIITQDFSVIFKFLCKLFLVIIAQQFLAESDGFPAPTITPCWFLHWDFYTSSFTPLFMQASRPSLSWTWIQFWSMMKRYKIHSLMTAGNIRTQVERWRKLEIAPRGNFVSFHGSGMKNGGFVAALLRRGTFDILWNGQAPYPLGWVHCQASLLGQVRWCTQHNGHGEAISWH
jgi:hypothetical protein